MFSQVSVGLLAEVVVLDDGTVLEGVMVLVDTIVLADVRVLTDIMVVPSDTIVVVEVVVLDRVLVDVVVISLGAGGLGMGGTTVVLVTVVTPSGELSWVDVRTMALESLRDWLPSVSAAKTASVDDSATVEGSLTEQTFVSIGGHNGLNIGSPGGRPCDPMRRVGSARPADVITMAIGPPEFVKVLDLAARAIMAIEARAGRVSRPVIPSVLPVLCVSIDVPVNLFGYTIGVCRPRRWAYIVEKLFPTLNSRVYCCDDGESDRVICRCRLLSFAMADLTMAVVPSNSFWLDDRQDQSQELAS